jgi:biotin carboxyl carrier protein
VVPAPVEPEVLELAASAVVLAGHENRRMDRIVLPSLEPGFRSNRFTDEHGVYDVAGTEIGVSYRNLGGRRFRVAVGGGGEREFRVASWDGEEIALERDDGRRLRVPVGVDGERHHALVEGRTITLIERPRFAERAAARIEGGCVAPMPGKVTKLCVQRGAEVARGDLLVVLEAMKMEHPVKAPRDGVIAQLLVGEGDQVYAEDLLVVVASSD